MTQENDEPGKVKVYTSSVKLNVPPPKPAYQFLNDRINTEMTYCGDVEKITYKKGVTKLSMASGILTLLLDESVSEKLASPPETFLKKNICVTGFLMPLGNDFQIVINDPGQIWLSGHK